MFQVIPSGTVRPAPWAASKEWHHELSAQTGCRRSGRFSDGSSEAIKVALSLTGTSAGLRLVHVLLPLDAVAPGAVWGTLDDTQRSATTRKYFDDFLKQNGWEGVESVVRVGDPGWEVAEYAKTVGGELIVIPSHGYHGLKRFVLGSVAERVIRHAQCPVLVLRRPDAE